MVSYVAGQRIPLAGVPDSMLRTIAQEYVKQNFSSIGATQNNYNEAITITQRSLSGSRTFADRFANIEAMRREALQGKSAQEQVSINKSYDLAIAFWGMRQELVIARNQANTQAQNNPEALRSFELPSLSERIRSFSQSAGTREGSMRTVEAGAWRSAAQSAEQARQVEETASRRAALSPIRAALDEVPAGNERNALQRLLTRANQSAQALGVNSPAALVANMHAALDDEDNRENYWWGSSIADRAKAVLRNAQAIAAARGVDNIFDAPAAQSASQGNGTDASASQPDAAGTGGAVGESGRTSSDIPPAPSGPDNEPYGPYRGQTYAASNTPRGTVREAQLLLEALGPEYSTGAGNTRRFGAGQQDASAMDGIVGEMTDAAIRKFQGENNLEVTGALDEATMTKLREVVAARTAAAGQGQTGDVPAPAPVAAANMPGADVATRAMATNQQNDVGADSASPGEQADDYSAYISTPAQAAAALARLGLTMTPEQISRITIQNGRIHSPDILRLEQALNAVRGDARPFEENGNFDSRLRRIMQTEGMGTFIGAVFSGTASAGDSQVPPPGGNGSGQAR